MTPDKALKMAREYHNHLGYCAGFGKSPCGQCEDLVDPILSVLREARIGALEDLILGLEVGAIVTLRNIEAEIDHLRAEGGDAK